MIYTIVLYNRKLKASLSWRTKYKTRQGAERAVRRFRDNGLLVFYKKEVEKYAKLVQ